MFLSGSGFSGPSAWPTFSRKGRGDWVFPERTDGVNDVERDVARMLEAGGGRIRIVASSYSGIAAMRAAELAPHAVESLVLSEPACFSIARGRAGVDAHVSALEPVFAQALNADVTDQQFSQAFGIAMGSAIPPMDEHVRAFTRLLRATTPPWMVKLDASVVARTPCLVVTSGRLPHYEDVAAELQGFGAQHVVLAGHGHRPLEHPAAQSMLDSFWTSEL